MADQYGNPQGQQQWTPAQTGTPAPPYSGPNQPYSGPNQPYSGPNQPGWAPPPPHQGPYIPGQVPPQGAFVIQQQPAPQTVVVLGGCPTCRVGHLEDEFTCLGILCCILFFPLGLLCLFTMREKRCTNCGATF